MPPGPGPVRQGGGDLGAGIVRQFEPQSGGIAGTPHHAGGIVAHAGPVQEAQAPSRQVREAGMGIHQGAVAIAAQRHRRPDCRSGDTAGSGSDVVNNIVSLTQAEYNAIGSPDAATLFLITDP
jgi:hypothetical protein